ncbi:hypothetical protein [Shimwellia blattae]|nr:hypothetical protein [Shimwellia blattae]GAB83024.1 hypothetical protein EB105725_40_00250 [Shimwellia blattae DSM 4481 = NBRC 105725]VDY63747.1 Uncharacterised protein [Shimwellia blattae]VEC21888.1 Uncharacterised protein [Shimwellia blattae]
MNNHFLILALFIILFVFKISYAQDALNNSTWVYDKVSNIDVFGHHDSSAIAHLTEEFEKVTIKEDGKKLAVENDFLESKKVCLTDYVEVKKTPLSYYLSKNTVNMYKQVYKSSNIPLPNDIYLLTSLYPGKECPPPYSEMLKVDNYLTVTKQNYVLFFKRQSKDLSENAGRVEHNNWSNYCHDDKAGQEFDGSSKASCSFPSMNINDAYNKLKEIDKSANTYLRPDLPTKNVTSKIDSGVVDYKWSGGGNLKITVEMESETQKYSFKQVPEGTSLMVETDSQY